MFYFHACARVVKFLFIYLSVILLLDVSNSDPRVAWMHAHTGPTAIIESTLVFCFLPVESSELNSNAMESFESALTCCIEGHGSRCRTVVLLDKF